MECESKVKRKNHTKHTQPSNFERRNKREILRNAKQTDAQNQSQYQNMTSFSTDKVLSCCLFFLFHSLISCGYNYFHKFHICISIIIFRLCCTPLIDVRIIGTIDIWFTAWSYDLKISLLFVLLLTCHIHNLTIMLDKIVEQKPIGIGISSYIPIFHCEYLFMLRIIQ